MGKRIIKKINVIVILGPTASGKTNLSVQLAKEIDMEIISADSRQIYKFLDIGTAKPTPEELNSVKHHFIDIINPDEYYSAGKFGSHAALKVKEIHDSGKIPVVVGGSGLYIKALCEGLFDEDIDIEQRNKIRKHLTTEFESKGIDPLYKELMEADSVSAQKYSDKNPVRIIRALEYYYLTGNKFSESQKNIKDNNIIPHYYGINYERDILYKRINERTENMWESGLEQETREILKMGFSPDLNSLNTVGYKEAIAFINGFISRQTAIEETKKNTRRYAKRQLTWFRKIENVTYIDGMMENKIEIILKKEFLK